MPCSDYLAPRLAAARPLTLGIAVGLFAGCAVQTDDEARELLRLFGFPFPKEDAADEKKAA